MNYFFDEHSDLTDEQLEFAIDWIAENRSDAPPLYLAPDFMLAPDLTQTHSEQDTRAFVERCRCLFTRGQIISVLDFFGPPTPGAKTILLTHSDWKFRQEMIDPHYQVLTLSHEDTPQTILRQLITIKLAHYLYRGDYARMAWLFDPISRSGFSPMNLLHRDYEFEVAINFVLLDWDENPINVDADNAYTNEWEASDHEHISPRWL